MSEQNSKISEMLDHLVNDDSAKAEELFHEYVVEKSREIYEGLIESEIEDEEVDEATDEDDEAVEEATDEEVDESSDDEEIEESADADDEEVEEGFDEVEFEEGDEEEADATDAMMGDVEDGDEDEEGEEGEEGDEDEPATQGDIMDLKTAIEDLEAAFKEYADSEEGEHGAEDEMEMDSFAPEFESEESDDLETVREYVEKVDGHGAEKKGKAESADNTSSPVASSNDMGGTTANIAKGGEGGGSETGLTGKPKDMNTKNINKVGGSKDAERMSKNGAGHGAERKGTGEGSADATSIIGSK